MLADTWMVMSSAVAGKKPGTEAIDVVGHRRNHAA